MDMSRFEIEGFVLLQITRILLCRVPTVIMRLL